MSHKLLDSATIPFREDLAVINMVNAVVTAYLLYTSG